MPRQGLMVALLAVLATALVAAGCGSDDSSTTSNDAAATTSTDTAATTTDATDTTESTTTDSGSVDTESVYNACVDAISGTPAAVTAEPLCEQVRTAFEGCAKQAESLSDSGARESTLAACQKAAEQATAALESAG